MSAKTSPGVVSKDEILHLAKLASLPVSPDEIAALEKDLGRIIGHVEHVLAASEGSLGTAAPPGPDAAGALGRLRPDVVLPGLSHEEALSSAPETADGGFSVPTFVSG